MNAVQLYLQTKNLSLKKVMEKLEALKVFLQEQRSHLMDDAFKRGLAKSSKLGTAVEWHIKTKRGMLGDLSCWWKIRQPCSSALIIFVLSSTSDQTGS